MHDSARVGVSAVTRRWRVSAEDTRAVMERYWNADHGDTRVMADDVVFTIVDAGEEHRGPDGVLRMLQDFYHRTFDATTEEVSEVVADGRITRARVYLGTGTLRA
jgi:hypothetical protein